MITASQIKGLLQSRHSKDVFVEECKDGPSGGGMLMMDAWAMKRSWANPCFYGYEIKISRSDFLSDTKWPGYLPLCNEFSFVCPQGVIEPDELSKDVGLIIVSKTGTRLFNKKRAPYRIIDTPDGLLMYILMARARIVKSTYYAEQEQNRGYWERWLADKTAKLKLGTRCSQKLNKSFTEQVREVNSKIGRMEEEMEAYKPIQEICKELHVNPLGWRCEEKLRQQIENMQQLVPPELLIKCHDLQRAIDQFITQVKPKE